MNLAETKRALRREARARRREAHQSLADEAGEKVRALFAGRIELPPDAVVGGYWPFEAELDAAPLLTHLHGLGHACAVPAVAGPDEALVFRAWKPGDRLLTGRLGEPRPDPAAPESSPNVLLVPLLSFDRDGFRLGYGGGSYDRTLARLRDTGDILAVGLAYAAQEVDAVPRDARDARLDWVVTEREAIEIGA